MSRGRGEGSGDRGVCNPGCAARTCPRAQARAGRARAATLGVCLGVWDCSVWDPGCDSVSGYDGASCCLRGLVGLPRPQCVGPRDVRLSGHDRPAVCAIVTCVSMCGVCLGGTGVCQAVCACTVPVRERDPTGGRLCNCWWVPAGVSVSLPDGALRLGVVCLCGAPSQNPYLRCGGRIRVTVFCRVPGKLQGGAVHA